MDKNIAALLREDTKTVHVVFDPVFVELVDLTAGTAAAGNYKKYTYVTDLDLKAGDTVVLDAQGKICVAYVVVVDQTCSIEPNSNIRYKWVIGKVDLEAHEANTQRNAEIENTVAKAYRKNLRRSFAQQILAGVDDANRDHLTKLLGSSQTETV